MQGDAPQQPGPRGVILIVEDNELNLKLLQDILDFHGYSTVVTDSGAAALDLALHHHPHLILLDIQLPDITGIEVVRRLKTDERTQAIPVVAVTAFAMPGDRTKLLDSGCDAYISKPFNILDILAMVEQYMDQTATKAP